MQLMGSARRNGIGLASLAAGMMLGLSTTAADANDQRESTAPGTYWLPVNVFPESQPVDVLFYFILILTSVVGLAVFVVMAWFLIQYRYRPNRHAVFIHGNNRLELTWTIVPTIILVLTAAASQASWTTLKNAPGNPSVSDIQNHRKLKIRVIAMQFDWFVQYPGPDGKLGDIDFSRARRGSAEELIGLDRTGDGADDVVLTELVIPVDTEVHIELVSKDVLHSFFLPHFRVKQDAVPGLRGLVWLRASQHSGDIIGRDPINPLSYYSYSLDDDVVVTTAKPYPIVCAELCGNGHYKMAGRLYAVSREEYARFIQAVYPSPADAGNGDDDLFD